MQVVRTREAGGAPVIFAAMRLFLRELRRNLRVRPGERAQ